MVVRDLVMRVQHTILVVPKGLAVNATVMQQVDYILKVVKNTALTAKAVTIPTNVIQKSVHLPRNVDRTSTSHWLVVVITSVLIL